tara:strand:- start:181 stop:402 length:222 start_codon:yes stop_codon:yes gene_type:complete
MNANIESWNVDLMGIGPIYPFVGSELLFTYCGVFSWLLWHFIQVRAEGKELAERQAKYSNPEALNSALDREQV